MSGELNHLGFIVDGNRRWAKRRGLPTLAGHERGLDRVEMVINELKDTEVNFASFFLFSTENWDRRPEEINYLMNLVETKFQKLIKKCQNENIKILILGRPDPVKPKIWAKMMDAEAQTKDNDGLTVCICFNYGGHWEIADVATKAIAAGEKELTPETFSKYLYHPEVPDCDLIVRTSGEQRISGFQLWRAAYSEFMFLDKCFPDMEPADCTLIIDEFHKRNRRFGK